MAVLSICFGEGATSTDVLIDPRYSLFPRMRAGGPAGRSRRGSLSGFRRRKARTRNAFRRRLLKVEPVLNQSTERPLAWKKATLFSHVDC